ncbi:hypothetical protein PoB_004372100 [Plakobranchus ocellatus]|uniref:Uncharacterized protein n=1 Tax=Plakobranchus ocellatus TaxID=259542 RepID=A0AAV4B1F6_9GAST|nr:hypothetical protein PoB_004372100 [Plakobranchus ocellatus]
MPPYLNVGAGAWSLELPEKHPQDVCCRAHCDPVSRPKEIAQGFGYPYRGSVVGYLPAFGQNHVELCPFVPRIDNTVMVGFVYSQSTTT